MPVRPTPPNIEAIAKWLCLCFGLIFFVSLFVRDRNAGFAFAAFFVFLLVAGATAWIVKKLAKAAVGRNHPKARKELGNAASGMTMLGFFGFAGLLGREDGVFGLSLAAHIPPNVSVSVISPQLVLLAMACVAAYHLYRFLRP